MNTIIDLLYKNLPMNSSKTALMHKTGERYQSITYSELIQKIEAFAFALKEKKIQAGDKIAILSKNNPYWIISDYATLSIGAISVPIYDTLTKETVKYILEDSNAKAIIVEDTSQLEKVEYIKENLKGLLHIIVMKPEKRSQNYESMEDWISLGMKTPSDLWYKHRMNLSKINPGDIATIIYTSGTTGIQKGVLLTHSNIVSNCETCLDLVKIFPSDVSLSFLPFSHIYARTLEYYGSLKSGSTIAFAEGIAQISENFLLVKPTIFFSVPRLYERLYTKIIENAQNSSKLKQSFFYWAINVGKEYNLHKDRSIKRTLEYKLASKLVFSKIKEKLGGRIRICFTGGGPISKMIQEFFYSIGLMILEGYGLTETSPVVTLNRENDFKFGSIGKPIPNVKVKIAEDGEILTKGPNVMIGYHNKEQETKKAFTEDGWFRTGDIGEMDPNGFITITDRKKDIFVLSTGKNVAPQFIENRVKLNKYISNIALVGHGRGHISALICPNFENLNKWAKINGLDNRESIKLINNPRVINFYQNEIDTINSEFAKFERIKKFKLLEKEFSIIDDELTPTLKIKRNIIEKKYKKEIEDTYV